MFKKWKARRRQSRRLIFKFWDGARERRADPMEVFRAIETDPKYRIGVTDILVDAGDHESIDTSLAMIRRVFGVAQWTESSPGLTEQETLELMANFCLYIAALKKNTPTTPTSSSATEASIWSESNGETTSDSVGSGFADIAAEPREPSESASA